MLNIVIGRHNSIDLKKDSDNSILAFVYWLLEIFNYNLLRTNINKPKLIEIIIDVIIYYHSFLDIILTDKIFFLT